MNTAGRSQLRTGKETDGDPGLQTEACTDIKWKESVAYSGEQRFK